MKKGTLLILCVLLAAMLFTSCSTNTVDPSVPEGYLRAGNDAVDYTFLYPNTWTLDRDDGMIGIKYNVGNNLTQRYASISTQAYSLEDANMGANDYWDMYKADIQTAYGNLVSFQAEKVETELGEVVANRNRYVITMDAINYLFEQVICVRYGNVYIVTFTTPEENYSEIVSNFDDVLTSFQFK